MSDTAPYYMEITEKAMTLVRQGRFHDAISMLEEVYEVALENDEHYALLLICQDLGLVYIERVELDKALVWLNRAYALSIEQSMELNQAAIAGNFGQVHFVKGDLDLALDWYLKAHAIFSPRGHNAIGAVAMNIAMVYTAKGDFPLSLEWYYKALQSFTTQDYWFGLAKVGGAIGDLYYETGDYEQAIEWYTEALNLYIENDSEAGIALKHSQIGQALMKLGNVDAAIRDLERGIQLSEKNDLQRELVVGHRLYAEALVSQGRFHEAGKHIEIAMPVIKKLKLQSEMCDSLAVLADVDRSEGKDDEAIAKLDEAIVIASAAGTDPQLRALHERLYKIKHDRDPKAALQHLEKVMELKDRMLGEQKQRRLALLEMEHKLDEERREIQVQMEQDKQLREQQRALLTNMMPVSIADRLMRETSMIADQHQDVAIMFIDLVNFTGLASNVPPTYVVYILNQIFEWCDEIIRRYGLTKVKTIGDAYLAIAGAPDAMDDPVSVMARAALDIRDFLEKADIYIPEELRTTSTAGLPEINARIGLNVGSLTAGVIGKERMAYDVWGDAVNVAARMEQTSETGRIHMSEAFAERCRNVPGLTVIPRGQLNIKGKGLMETFWLERGS